MKYIFLFVFLSCSFSIFAQKKSFDHKKELSSLERLDEELRRNIERLRVEAEDNSKDRATPRRNHLLLYSSTYIDGSYQGYGKLATAIKEAVIIRKIFRLDTKRLKQLRDYGKKYIINLDASKIDIDKLEISSKLSMAYMASLLMDNDSEAIAFLRKYVNTIKRFQNAEQFKTESEKIMTDANLQLTADIAMAIPLLGEAIDVYSIASGEDAITGEKHSKMLRGFNAFMLLAPDLLKVALAKNPALAKKLASLSDKLSENSGAASAAMKRKAKKVKDKLALVLKKTSVKMTKSLKNKHGDMLKALKSSDDDILALYKNGGMKNLSELEQLGKISKKQADKLNNVLSKHVDDAIDTGTQDAMKVFQNSNDVKIKKVWQGDSGSSAMGQSGRSVNTDADRTFIVDFDQADLEKYAKKNNINVSEAQEKLQEKFCKKQKEFTDDGLKARGLNNDDVGYETYSGMGGDTGAKTSGSGGHRPTDTYSSGITQARQTQGTTKIYEFNKNGGVNSPRKTSGEALTDHNALKYNDTTMMRQGGPKITVGEAKSVLDQQVLAMKKVDVTAEKAAKALERAEKSAALLKMKKTNPNLKDIALKLRGPDPQAAYKSMTKEQQRKFVEQCKEKIYRISREAK